MAIVQYLKVRCDRCRFESEMKFDAMRDAWGRLEARETNGPFAIESSHHGMADICPRCMVTLAAWWNDGILQQ